MSAGEQADLALTGSSVGRGRLLALHGLWLGLFALAFAPTALWLWQRWTISIWYSGHGVFMPFIVAYLFWDRLHQDQDPVAQASPWGFAFLGAGLGLLALDAAIGTQLLAALGLIVCLPGLTLLLLGAQRTRGLVFALIIACFMLPIPAGFVSSLHLVLREITAFFTAQLLPLFGVPVSMDGTLLRLPRTTVAVADACSGFSTLYAAVTTALILSHLNGSRRLGVLLIASSVVLAIICNTIRVTALVLLVHYGSTDLLETPLHQGSGIASFSLVILLLFLIAGKDTFRKRAG